MVFYTDCELFDPKWQSHSPQKSHSSKRSNKATPKGRNGRSRDPFPLAILRTNRQIYQEAISVLYSENAFHFIGSNYLPILDFVRRLSPHAKTLVRKIRITWLEHERGPKDTQFNLFCMAILDSLPGLISFDSGAWVWF
jgi:hypothetical protein